MNLTYAKNINIYEILSDIKNVSLEENEFHRDKKSNGENDSHGGNESHVIPTRNGTIYIYIHHVKIYFCKM